MKPSDFAPFFSEKLKELPSTLSSEQQYLLLQYLDEMLKWNRVYNLTAIISPQEMMTKHLLDSLVIAPFLSPEQQIIADVGTGAGFPGIPLAVFYPQKQWFLIESSEKKCCFLRHIKGMFGLNQVEVISSRVESFVASDHTVDVLISRAFSDLTQFLKKTAHLAKSQTQWFALKGKYPHNEMHDLECEAIESRVHRLNVPGLDAERHLVILKKIRAGE